MHTYVHMYVPTNTVEKASLYQHQCAACTLLLRTLAGNDSVSSLLYRMFEVVPVLIIHSYLNWCVCVVSAWVDGTSDCREVSAARGAEEDRV